MFRRVRKYMSRSKKVLKFISEGGKYECFSNFSSHGFFLDGKDWRTVEHFFQAKKFEGTDYEELVRLAKTPMKAKKLGREFPLRQDWNTVKEDYMEKGLVAKFTQNEDCLKILLGTGTIQIVEDKKSDFYWGIGDGSGRNRLGVLLMKTRELLRDNTWDDALKFYYETDDPYGCFSNYSDHSFVLEGKEWATSEHYFQAKKYEGTENEEKVRLAKSPGEAKKMGNDKSLPKRKDWQGVKEKFMEKALQAKFTQNEDIKKILLGTASRKLAEDARKDYYWGIGMDGSGKNRLGVLLMELRDELKKGE